MTQKLTPKKQKTARVEKEIAKPKRIAALREYTPQWMKRSARVEIV